MAGKGNAKPRRVAIVGVEGSGKTVMLAGLGDLYAQPDAHGFFLQARNFDTASYVLEIAGNLRAGRWPDATDSDAVHGLDWTLRRRTDQTSPSKDICSVSFLDFPGEAYRAAFGVTEGAAAERVKRAVKTLQNHLAQADDLIVLVNLRDVIVNGPTDRRVREAMWITSGILQVALDDLPENRRPRAAIALSQSDSYADTIAACGGPRKTLARYLPDVAVNYGWLDVLAVSSVADTVLDDEGVPHPAQGFSRKGLSPLMDWIVSGAAPVGRSRRTVVATLALALFAVGALGVFFWHRAPTSSARTAVLSLPPGARAGEVRTVTLSGGATLELLWCPPGTFTMGSPELESGRRIDETQHKVTLTQGFWLGRYPVTQRQWLSVMGTNPSYRKGMERPVECVSWGDCLAFCEKAGLGLRLPTEAEWEYACRARTQAAYYWGDALNGDRANCDGHFPCGTVKKGSYRGETTFVGAYEANAWGLYDMHGNVCEWCADWYGEYAGRNATNPKGAAPGRFRVSRGGSWFGGARSCRAAHRDKNVPDKRSPSLGFRVALSPGS